MAPALPAALKIPSVQPFATRAVQLDKYRPSIAHWCNYHVVETIISNGLHDADDECRAYTEQLMDKLEAARSQNPPVDAIVDHVAAKAYVEQFALETFEKADDQIHTSRATRQTVDTFQAASTFLELLSIWGPLDAEVSSQIKYAKFHALRIVKALRAGEDPNLSNPKSTYVSPTVESAPDSAQPSRTGSTLQSAPLAPAPPTPGSPAVPATDQARVSPIIAHEDAAGQARDYFPVTETAPAQDTSAPSATKDGAELEAFYHSSSQPAQASSSTGNTYRTDDEAVAKAQKHAKWAISALNFEDVNTAVKELTIALQALGAA